MQTDDKHTAELNDGEKDKILFTLIYKDEEYLIQTEEKKYFSLMTLISDYLSIPGFGLCSGMGSCGTCLVNIDGNSTTSCQIPVNDDLAHSRITIDDL